MDNQQKWWKVKGVCSIAVGDVLPEDVSFPAEQLSRPFHNGFKGQEVYREGKWQEGGLVFLPDSVVSPLADHRKITFKIPPWIDMGRASEPEPFDLRRSQDDGAPSYVSLWVSPRDPQDPKAQPSPFEPVFAKVDGDPEMIWRISATEEKDGTVRVFCKRVKRTEDLPGYFRTEQAEVV